MNGKGDRNRSQTQAYRDGWERVFGPKPFGIRPYGMSYWICEQSEAAQVATLGRPSAKPTVAISRSDLAKLLYLAGFADHPDNEEKQLIERAQKLLDEQPNTTRHAIIPPLELWNDPKNTLPKSDSIVLARAAVDPDAPKDFSVVVASFSGNEFCHDFFFGQRSVYVSHWIYMTPPSDRGSGQNGT